MGNNRLGGKTHTWGFLDLAQLFGYIVQAITGVMMIAAGLVAAVFALIQGALVLILIGVCCIPFLVLLAAIFH